MDRQGTENPPPLPSQHLSPDAQQNSTIPTYRDALGDFLQKVPSQTHASASFNVPNKRLSVDRTSNNLSQHSGDIEPEDKDNISDSGATTEPLADGVLENLHYRYEAGEVERSPKICHVGEKVLRDSKYVRNVRYVVETYLPDNWLPGNARFKLRKQEEKQQRKKEKIQRKKRLSTLRPRPSTRN
ncbi:hypothetical protein BDBG_07321 [Blastomyces gilchristii SLH14081]|uniref:Uncharacterized protein n=1 Tax=Blastomyces gilchristii (strain SLH14081) TaxID=559298 RepID=A0A179UXS8_BLAGS|nr:uncharacterized protein BDBG_07321 [Blastomyces gilchristii SLH14081]OAT11907.1 hypothetical protein BDBG_07321 [Blastomyces gilchristii SLH14081]